MEINNLRFKTSLNCAGCVAKVSADLDHAAGIVEWHVDVDHPEKILTVKSIGISQAEVILLIQNKGFAAEPYCP